MFYWRTAAFSVMNVEQFTTLLRTETWFIAVKACLYSIGGDFEGWRLLRCTT